jgi:hypothetical protein
MASKLKIISTSELQKYESVNVRAYWKDKSQHYSQDTFKSPEAAHHFVDSLPMERIERIVMLTTKTQIKVIYPSEEEG